MREHARQKSEHEFKNAGQKTPLLKSFQTKNHQLKKLLTQKRGLSLVEVVVSLALLAFISILLLSVMLVSLNTISANAELKKSDAEAAAGLEHKFAGEENPSVIEKENDVFVFEFEDATIEVYGERLRGTDEKEDAAFNYFEP